METTKEIRERLKRADTFDSEQLEALIRDADLAEELLEALEGFYEEYMNAPADATFGDGILNQERVRAAIAKARGED